MQRSSVDIVLSATAGGLASISSRPVLQNYITLMLYRSVLLDNTYLFLVSCYSPYLQLAF